MIECAKYVGLTIFSAVLLAIPALLALSIAFNWGSSLIYLLIVLVLLEICLIIFAIEALADEDIL